MPAYCNPSAFAAFAEEIPRVDTTGGLFRAAFAISRHEKPGADVEQGAATIAELADTVRRRVRSENPQAKLAHLHDVLFDVAGFVGNVEDYYNPANSYLPDVLSTRRGMSINRYSPFDARYQLSSDGVAEPSTSGRPSSRARHKATSRA